MSLISKLKLIAEIKSVASMTGRELQSFDMESLKRRIEAEKSDFIARAFMIICQKRNLLNETFWACNDFNVKVEPNSLIPGYYTYEITTFDSTDKDLNKETEKPRSRRNA